MSNLGRNKILNNQTKEVVYNVFLYVTSLRTNRETRPSLGKIKEEVSRATGVSFASICRIVKEAKDSEKSGQPAFSREVQNKRKRKFYVTGLENENFNAEDIRRIILEFHQNDCRLTIQALRKKLQEDYNWTGSDSSMRRIIRRLGFNWTKNDPQVLIVESGNESSLSEPDSVNMDCPMEDEQKVEEESSQANWNEWKEPCDRVIKLEPEQDTVDPIRDMQRLTEQEFSKITTDDWKERCDRVIKLEAEYLKREYNVNVTVNDLVSDIKTEQDSDAESDLKTCNSNGDI